MSREGRKKEVHRVLNGFLWSKGGVTGREIFMHPPLSLSLSRLDGDRPVRNRRHKNRTPFDDDFCPLSRALDGLAHIRPPLPSAVVA